MNSKQKYRVRRLAEYNGKKAEAVEVARKKLEVGGCSARVTLAMTTPPLRNEHSGSICLPDVAIYQAGHRKSVNVTAR
jgi:hypothetical protein